MKFITYILTVCFVLVPSLCSAHSMWVVLQPSGQRKMVAVWYADRLEPGRAMMLDRLQDLQVLEATEGASRSPVKVVRFVTEETGSLVGTTTSPEVTHVEAICDIGVRALQRPAAGRQRSAEQNPEHPAGPEGTAPVPASSRQIYYAKYLQLDPQAKSKVTSNPAMELDLIAEMDGEDLVILVTFQGEPLPLAGVSGAMPDGSRFRLEADELGEAVLENAPSGRYTIKSRYEQDQPGSYKDQPYTTINRDVSLVLDLR